MVLKIWSIAIISLIFSGIVASGIDPIKLPFQDNQNENAMSTVPIALDNPRDSSDVPLQGNFVGGTGYSSPIIGDALSDGSSSRFSISESGQLKMSKDKSDIVADKIPKGSIGIDEDGEVCSNSYCSNDYFTIPEGAQTEDTFKIYVIGDSIAWGNGLEQKDKYYYDVAKHIQESIDPKPVEVIVYAHSGAVISDQTGDSMGSKKDANLNSGYPTLVDQAKHISDDADLILVSGGINDIGINNIFDANTPPEKIEERSKDIISPMKNLLIDIMGNTDAKIVVTGYYPLITDESDTGWQDNVIADFLAFKSEKTVSQWEDYYTSAPIVKDVKAGAYLGERLYNNHDNIAKDNSKLKANSDAFYKTSSESLSLAVHNADNHENRVIFVNPSFESKNSYGTSDTFLWKSTGSGEPPFLETNDDMSEERSKLTNPLDYPNRLNPIAHPNENGASKYAESIKDAIDLKGSEWLTGGDTEEKAITAAADSLLVGFPESESKIKWLGTDPKDISQSNTQETTQVAIQPDNAKFFKGARVEVTDSLHVRDAPGLSSGEVMSTKPAGSTATVLSGPYYKDDFTWWEVQYNDGTTGYSQEKRLELIQTSGARQTPVSSSSKYELETNSKEPAQTTIQSNDAKFSKGDRIEVTDSLNVRDLPGLSSGSVLSTKSAGSTATVLSGPYHKDDFTWWEVRYDDGTEGYSQEKRLELVQTSVLSQPPASSSSKYELESNLREPAQTTIQSNDAKFSKGDRIEVTDSLNVRDSPGLSSGTVTSTKAAGSTATVLSGPYHKDNFTWWEVRYDDGTTGYSQEKRLELAKTSVSSQTPVSSGPKYELETNSKEPVQRYSNDKFSKGDRIEVTDSLNVRDAPGLSSGTVISTRTAGSTATVLSGPYYRDDFTWWEVRYDDGTTGYSQEKRLELAQTSASNQPPVVQPVDLPSVSEPIDKPSDFAFGDNQQLADSAYISQIPSSNSEFGHRDSSTGPLPGQVQLEVNLRNENGNPAPAGTKVLIEDGSGNYVKANLDSNGYALVYGDPGTWTIAADAPGYATNTGYTSVSRESSHSSFRMNLQKGGTNDLAPLVNSPIAPQSSASPAEQPTSSAAIKVSLEIDLRNENGNAVPAGTKVIVRDGSGNIVPTNWDSNGHTIAYGDPGTWTITAEVPGYATNMYYAAVSSSSSSTSTRIYLQKNGYIDQPPQQSSPTINPASQSANQQSSQQSTNGQSVSQTQDEKLSKTQKDAILIDLLESRTKGKDLSADEVDALMNDLDELGRQLDQQSGQPPADNGPAFGDNADDGTAFGDNLHEGTAFGM